MVPFWNIIPSIELMGRTGGTAVPPSPSPLKRRCPSFCGGELVAAGWESFNETSDYYHGPADRSGGHHDSARHCGSVCRDQFHIHFGNSTILTASAFRRLL